MSPGSRRLIAQTVHPGEAAGLILPLEEPLSLWGGLDVESGLICDVTHPQCGESMAGRIVLMESGRGSSSSASSLVEAARRNTAPAGIVLARPDAILSIGALLAADLYQVDIPIVLVNADDWPHIASAKSAKIKAHNETAQVDCYAN